MRRLADCIRTSCGGRLRLRLRGCRSAPSRAERLHPASRNPNPRAPEDGVGIGEVIGLHDGGLIGRAVVECDAAERIAKLHFVIETRLNWSHRRRLCRRRSVPEPGMHRRSTDINVGRHRDIIRLGQDYGSLRRKSTAIPESVSPATTVWVLEQVPLGCERARRLLTGSRDPEPLADVYDDSHSQCCWLSIRAWTVTPYRDSNMGARLSPACTTWVVYPVACAD